MWKPIKNYEGLYEVSNLGRIKSLEKNRPGQSNSAMLKKLSKSSNGYFKTSLYKNGKSKTFAIHRLVIESFTGVSRLQVNHKDGRKENNNLNNLEYCTQRENVKHAIDIGLRNNKGERNVKAKLNEKQIKEIRRNKNRETAQELSKRYNVFLSTIYKIVNGETWAHVS